TVMKRRRLVRNLGPPRFITIRTSPVPFKIGILTSGIQTGMALRQSTVSRYYVERRDKPACCRGCKSPTGKENSESILASSLAGGIVRWCSKRRQRYRWAGRLSFEKPLVQDADLLT